MSKRKKDKENKVPGKGDRTNKSGRAKRAITEIVELTDAFCRKHLNEEYLRLCEEMAGMLYALDVPIEKGKAVSWASGIVHAIGWVNCLYDPTMSPHITSREIAEGFGVSQGTMTAKSRIVRDGLKLVPLDPDWCISVEPEDNPMVWMVDIGGLMMDIRYAPRQMQEEAYRMGLIPFIPGDKQEQESESGKGIKIIEFPSKQSETSRPKSATKLGDDGPNLFEGLEK